MATLPKNSQVRPLPGLVRFACWDSPKPLLLIQKVRSEFFVNSYRAADTGIDKSWSNCYNKLTLYIWYKGR